MPYKILFVCLGNICRSPAAEGVMNHIVAEANLSHLISCDSAGTSSYHVGSSPDKRMTAAAKARDIVLQGQARQLQKSDLDTFDLILAMDRQNYHDIIRLASDEKHQDKIRLMCDFATHHQQTEVPDPYYGGAQGFNLVIDLLLDACQGLLKELEVSSTLQVK
ncbi:low molecular weight protein-tyrosine-phosphatase [Merismopedia glauca]|uniref:protein-tyrosine-phosphatase n=1 Tax=Merismopedia glauca CCAP 1448/3 TaxID=1296344 RepID=A0A2T1C0N8_9CYAN|nr:low molecular weight protein-tyrosine-phosphatase [Merismopedia glauca]PSB01738.1 protein tyrosine phosphatase [Merismopedia glauca CCAP 1448/3]